MYINFKNFDDQFDRVLKTFFYDDDYSIQNVEKEKIKHNFSTRHWQQLIDGSRYVLIYDIHGINPDDIKVTKVYENGAYYIKIEGSTRCNILDCDMSVNARWAIPYRQFKKPTKKIENSLLYVFVEPDTVKEEDETI